jgi:hypothetical protein
MNDTITTPNATLTPYAINTDRVRTPEIKENETGTLSVDFEQLQPLEHRLGKSLTFGSTAQREAAQKIINDPPKTLGELWYDYLMLVAANANTAKNLAALERGLGKVNYFLNEHADNENWCSEYEDKLSDMTSLLVGEGYTGWFTFTGRVEEVDVMVERRRVVLETVTVRMEKPKGSDLDYSDAVDQASEYDDELWDVQDDCYDTDYYEVINVENVY